MFGKSMNICSGVARAEGMVEGGHVKLAKPALLGVPFGTGGMDAHGICHGGRAVQGGERV